MRKYKTKIITVFVILAILAGAWFMGGAPDVNIVPIDAIPAPPALTEAEAQPAYGGSFIVILSVRVDSLLLNMHLLDREKHELVPPDGAIFPAAHVIAYEGESVFDVLQREMRRNRIHMASRFTPLHGSAYVEAINNLYEFDAGPLSGWMYKVNGESPGVGASLYILQPGDIIEWMYTVDLGRDIGAEWIAGD